MNKLSFVLPFFFETIQKESILYGMGAYTRITEILIFAVILFFYSIGNYAEVFKFIFSLYGYETWSLTIREKHRWYCELGAEENIWTEEE
jgi:hypothetical protein